MSGILSESGIGFPAAPNAVYGLPHMAAMLLEMCQSGTTSEETARKLGYDGATPSAKWFRNMVNSLGPEMAENLCRTLLGNTARLARRESRYKGGILVAVDKHLIPRHDKDNMMYLVRSKPSGGTSKFECYATMQAVAEPVTAVLDCVRVTRDMFEADFVRSFMRKLGDYRIRARLLLLDREFYSTEIIGLVSDMGHRFLMPAVKNAGVKRAILEHHAGKRDAVSRYTLRNSQGESAAFTLAITPSKKADGPEADIVGRYHVFATNLSARRALSELETLPEEYRSRWGIETGYRQIEQVRPRTASRDHSFRMILFYASLFMYNVWGIARYREDRCRGMLTLAIMAYIAARTALDACRITGIPYDPGGYG